MKLYIIINRQTGKQVPSFDRDWTYGFDDRYWDYAMRPVKRSAAVTRTHELNKRVNDKFRYKIIPVEVDEDE